MLARPQLAPPLDLLPDISGGTEREAVVGADVLTDWTTRFVTQFAVPTAQLVKLRSGRHDEEILVEAETGSFAALHEEDSRRVVRQGGPDALWDAVEDHLGRWHAAGTPTLEEAAVRVPPQVQSIHWRRAQKGVTHHG